MCQSHQGTMKFKLGKGRQEFGEWYIFNPFFTWVQNSNVHLGFPSQVEWVCQMGLCLESCQKYKWIEENKSRKLEGKRS